MINIRNARTSTKGRAKPFILGKNNPMHHYMLGAAQLESILAKKNQKNKLTQKRFMVSYALLDQALPAV